MYYVIEQQYLVPEGELHKILSRLAIAGWEFSGARCQTDRPWSKDGQAIVTASEVAITAKKCQYYVTIDENASLFQMMEDIKPYQSVAQVDNFSAVTLLRDALDLVGTPLPPVLFNGMQYTRNLPFPANATVTCTLGIIAELGTVVVITTSMHWDDAGLPGATRTVNDVRDLVVNEVQLQQEWRVHRPWTLLLQDKNVTWEMVYADGPGVDFGTPQFNAGEYFELDEDGAD